MEPRSSLASAFSRVIVEINLPPSLLFPPTSTAWDDPWLHIDAVFGDVAGAREPDLVGVLMLDAMLDRLAQRPQPHRLAEDVTMKRDRADERLIFRCFQQLLELIDHHVG